MDMNAICTYIQYRHGCIRILIPIQYIIMIFYFLRLWFLDTLSVRRLNPKIKHHIIGLKKKDKIIKNEERVQFKSRTKY